MSVAGRVRLRQRLRTAGFALAAVMALVLGAAAERADAAGSSANPCVAAPPPLRWNHVIVLMFENHSHEQVIGAKDSSGNLLAPYITNLASQCGTSFGGTVGAAPKNNWHDADYKVNGSFDGDYNSKPSYAVLTNGRSPSATGIVDDTYSTMANVDNIYNQARVAGLDAKSFYDGPASTTPCAYDNFNGGYHDPIRYYTNLGGQNYDTTTYCNTHDKTLPDFWNALNARMLPAFSTLLPTNAENMHDTTVASIKAGDSWAQNFLPALFDSAQYQSGDTAVFFLWDEETAIPNVLLAPSVVPGSKVAAPSGNPISHFAGLRTFEEMLGLPLLGDAAQAPSLLSFFNGCASSCVVPPPDTQPPSSPGNLAATKDVYNEVDLAWSASSDDVGVTGYNLFRDGSMLATVGAGTTTYNDTAVAASTSYTYTVSAFDAAGNVSQPSTLSVTTPATPDTTPPSAPAGLAATVTSPQNVDLTWSASSDNVGVAGYNIERSTNGGSFVLIKQVGAVTRYSDGSVAGGSSYIYRVRAVDAAGNVSQPSGTASVTTPAAPDTIPPSAPSGLKATAASATQVNLNWNASTDNVGVTAYDVFRAPGGSNTFAFAATVPGSTRSFSNTGLAANTRYNYYVKARDAAGNISATSNQANVTTKPK